MFPDIHGSIVLVGRTTERELRELEHRRILRARRRHGSSTAPGG